MRCDAMRCDGIPIDWIDCCVARVESFHQKTFSPTQRPKWQFILSIISSNALKLQMRVEVHVIPHVLLFSRVFLQFNRYEFM
jgi:hypothetical protein